MDTDVPVFHYLTLLPKELRGHIWTFVIVNIPPRVVEIETI